MKKSNERCVIIGYTSYRDLRKGSWFIRALSDELKKALSSQDDVNFAELMTKVTHTVAYDYSTQTSGRWKSIKQVPCLYSTLTKHIHFPNRTLADQPTD